MRCLLLLLPPAAAVSMLPKGFKVPDHVKDHTKDWRLEDWKVEHKEPFLHEDGYNVTTTTYTSPVVKLMTGESMFSVNAATLIPFPKGDYTILQADFQIIDGSTPGQIPLNEVYNHHWLLGGELSPLSPCEDNLFFGAGAEMRGMPTKFNKGVGMVRIGATGVCGGNLHWIRTEDLKTEWSGKNNPNGSLPAAIKNCIECGWAPKRAPECLKALDGTFACCLGGARCPVNNPDDKSTKDYRLQYEVQWTKQLTGFKLAGGGVLDMSGKAPNPGTSEWNVGPNVQNLKWQVCNSTVCNATQTWKVEGQTGFQSGICPGEILFSYLHQHTGAISGTMFINGKKICTSYPVPGTDPNNAPGNEQGYNVKFSPCIDKDSYGVKGPGTVNEAVRVELGDEITVECLYDVDPDSKRNYPFPGGHHGGVMGLYFFSEVCDPGTFKSPYVCRDNQCVPAPHGNLKDLETCEAAIKAGTADCPVGPAPPGPAKYRCKDSVCVVSSDGVDLATCESACS